MRERRFGTFERALRIPETVDSNKIEARFKKGVLRVTLLKTGESKKPVRKIELKGE
jgi:HSP20 family protein